MAFTTQKMTVAGMIFVTNPDADSGFEPKMLKSDFVPIGATESLVQVHGMASGERELQGYFFADADYQLLLAVYLRRLAVPCTDWRGQTFMALITALKPAYVNDGAHDFQTVRYRATLQRRPA